MDTTVDEIYQNHYATVLRYVQRRVGCPQVVQDLTGDVFCKAVRTFESYRPLRASALPWLYTIAANTVTDHYRRRRPFVSLDLVPEAASREAGPDELVARRDLADQVWTAAAQLPAAQQQALRLRFGEDRDLADIARTMGRSVMAVKLLIHRAVRGVRARLEAEPSPTLHPRRRSHPAAVAESGRASAATIGRWPRPAGRSAGRRSLTVA